VAGLGLRLPPRKNLAEWAKRRHGRPIACDSPSRQAVYKGQVS